MALSDNPTIASTPAYHERGCKLGRWAKTLPDADRQVLQAWLENKDIPHAAIAKRITDDPDYDIEIKSHVVQRHRAKMRGNPGGCGCGSR